MKTAMIARFVLGAGAIFAVAGLAGCGAGEQGSGAPEGVGVSSEALLALPATTIDDITLQSSDPRVSAPRDFAASCTIHDSNTGKDLVLVAGGLTAAGTVTNAWELFDPSGAAGSAHKSNQFIKDGTFSTVGRSHAKMLQIASDKCLLVGGLDGNGTAVTTDTSRLFTLTNGPTITVTAAGSLNSPRGKAALLPCGTGGAILIGGVKTTNTTTLSGTHSSGTDKTIEVFDGSAWHPATHGSPAVATDLFVERYDFGVIKDPSGDNYLMAGGSTSTSVTKNLEIINVSNSCDYTQVANTLVGTTATHQLSATVTGNVLVPEGGTNKILSAAGYDGTLRTTTDVISVNWGTPTSTTVASGGAALPFGTWLPTVVTVPYNSNVHVLLVGGGDSSAPANAIAKVQEFKYTPGSNTTGTWNSVSGAGFTARYGAVAEYVPSQNLAAAGADPLREFVYALGGQTAAPAFLSVVQDIKVYE